MPADPTGTPGTAPAPARRGPWRWWLAGLAALLLAVLLGLLAAARWTLATEAGARWLLARLPGVSASGVQGSVLGGSLGLQQLRIEWNQGRASLTLEDVAATGLRWRWRPADAARGTWVALDMDTLQVRQAHYISGPPSADAGPLRLPDSLALPLQLSLNTAAVQTLLINELAPLSALRIEALQLDNRPGALYAVKAVQAQWQGLQLQGSLQMAHAAPFATQAQLGLAPSADGDSPAWAASARAQGPLDGLALQATLRGVPRAERPAPSLDLRAELRLLQPWPLGTLQAQTEALDLAALHPAAPQTRLSGQAELQTQAADGPLSARLQLDNALPGRWDEGRLPARRLQLQAQGQLNQPGNLRLSRFSVELADALRPAGRWTGSAQWQGHELKLDTELDDIQPQRLDGRAPAMRLTGPLALQLDGLPSLDPAAAGSRPPPWLARLQLQLQGLVEGAPLPVKVQLRAEADAHRLELLQAQAATGTARADTRAKLQRRDARSPWQLATSGQLNGFDPLPWLPGGAGAPGETWRRGPHRLSGQWQFDLRLPSGAENLAPLVLLQRLAGNGALQLRDSMLAGLPLQADVQLRHTPGAGSLEASLNLADAQLKLQARGDPGGDGASDQWQASLQAPQLAALAPLARLWPASAPWAPSQGSAQLQLAASGRWPEVRTEGHAQVQQLQAGKLSLTDGRFDWTLDLGQGPGPQQPLALTLDVAGLQLGLQRAEQLRGTVRGLLAEHRIDIEAVLPVLPPAATANVLGLRIPSPAPGARNGTRGLLLAEGRWRPAPGGGGRWDTAIEKLSVGGWDGRVLPVLASTGRDPGTAGPPDSPNWAEARKLRAELQFDATGALASLRADAGELRLADTTSLRWEAVRADLQADPLRLELRAQVDPFPVAPLLARLQPELGWKGDLQLGARVQLMAGETFEADILVERSQGDLAAGGTGAGNGATNGVTSGVTSGVPNGAAMGLSELRLALRAQNGLWNFQADAAGALLGELRGALQVRSTPQARWPGPQAPMEGQLQLQVANIGIWNAWVPAGWRMAGSLQGNARVDGRFGAPRYTGVIDGSKLALRNLLQGVNITDGEVKVRLTGDEATIETFALRGGEGTLTVSGGAQFGERPRTRLQLQAERFRVLGRVDRQLIASGQATAELDRDSLRLDGRITADEGLFDLSGGDAPSLDGDVNVRRPGQVQAEEEDGSKARPRRAARVNLVLDLGQQLRLRGRGLDTGLRGQITLTSPNNRLVANGSIATVDGSYVGYGQKMSIERGLVAFNGPLDNPRLDVLALRPNLDIRVGVAITGALSAYRVRLYSEPEMSENAKLSWLLLGREPDGLGRADTALLQRAAVALLSGEGEAPTDALLRNLGIDELSLRQGDGDVRETVITLGKQLSRRWYLGYERGVNATTGTWQLIYRVAQRFTLRAQSGLENSLDVIWVWRPGEAADGSRPPGSAPVRKSVVTPP